MHTPLLSPLARYRGGCILAKGRVEGMPYGATPNVYLGSLEITIRGIPIRGALLQPDLLQASTFRVPDVLLAVGSAERKHNETNLPKRSGRPDSGGEQGG